MTGIIGKCEFHHYRMGKKKNQFQFSQADLQHIKSRDDLLEFFSKNDVNLDRVNEIIRYEDELQNLQIELLKLQNCILNNKKRVVVIF